MITEIIVNNYSLDLHKEEAILMKYTSKDLQDLSKVFSPFSQDFSFPATSKNLLAFDFFGETDVQKSNTENKYPCKIYVNGMLSQNGFIILKDIKYSNGKPTDISGSFGTTMTNLKDKIGDSLITELFDSEVLVDVQPNNMFDLTQSVQNQTVDSVLFKYYTPLISNYRVWDYEELKFTGGTDAIEAKELRPALAMNSILDMIFKKYNLDIECPLQSRAELSTIYMWCNAEYQTRGQSRVKLLPGDPFSYPSFVDGNTTTDIINIKDIAVHWFSFRLDNIQYFNNQDNKQMNLVFKRASDNSVFKEVTKDISGSMEEIIVTDLNNFFIGSNLEFYIEISFNCPLTWTNNRIKVQRYRYSFLDASETNGNNAPYNSSSLINIVKALPKIKTIDFLTSFFKSFNISVFDVSPNNDKLYWLTPSDVNEYKSIVDYTRYVDVESLVKSNTSDYNYYNFKHADSDYFSNVAYKTQYGIEYGQVRYPEIKPPNAKEYLIETQFNILPPVTVSNTDIVTSYGFGVDFGQLYDVPTIFYNAGTNYGIPTIAFKKTTGVGVYVRSRLDQFLSALPYRVDASLAFSIIQFSTAIITDSLFKLHYQENIARMINPNVLAHDFTLTLPSTELYLNENTTIKPTGFRQMNDIVIGETKYSLVDAEIDITTGKTKLKLINYGG